MEDISTTELTKRIGELLEAALMGTRYRITRHRRAIGFLLPPYATVEDRDFQAVTSTDLYNNAGDLVKGLIAGQAYEVTRHGRRVALITPAPPKAASVAQEQEQ